jgi:hypothetical protein
MSEQREAIEAASRGITKGLERVALAWALRRFFAWLRDGERMPTPTLATTLPSDYDTDGRWCCTIGKAESEEAARALCAYLVENGDEWHDVALEVLEPWAEERGYSFVHSWTYLFRDEYGEPATSIYMPEHWLRFMPRRRRTGPPEIVRDGKSIQYLWPNGERLHCGHKHSDVEVEALWMREPRQRGREGEL